MNQNLFSRIQTSITDQSAPLVRGKDQLITYQDMLDRSAQYANVLTELGLKPGERVAVQADKSLEVLFLYLGCIRAGGVYLPLNTSYPDQEVSYFVEDAAPAILVVNEQRAAGLKEVAAKHNVAQLEIIEGVAGSLAEKASGAGTEFEDVVRADEDLAAILYTSGTTGRSKGAMLTHHNLYSNAQTLVGEWRFTSSDVLLHALPIYHTHGLFVASNTVLLSGASMIFHNQFKAEDVMEDLPEASVLMGVPTFYTRLLNEDGFDRDLVSNMRLFISGSAPLSPQTHKEFEARTGHVILERYGMTETNMNISNPYEGERRAGTVGFPLPEVEVRIIDSDSGSEVKTGNVGMIEVRGPNVFTGYWQMPEKTAEEFRDDGFFITGDLGMVDEDGYVSIVGRNKDLIITGGLNVYPAEVENVIDALEGITEVAVIGVPHADFGEGVVAVVVTDGVA